MKFLRRIWYRHSKLGRNRKKKQNWRKPRGRDNKMREKRKGYPKVVSIGYGKSRNEKGKVNGRETILVHNLKDLEKVQKNDLVILGNVGKKRKIELANEMKKLGLEATNLNVKKMLKEKKK